MPIHVKCLQCSSSYSRSCGLGALIEMGLVVSAFSVVLDDIVLQQGIETDRLLIRSQTVPVIAAQGVAVPE